MAFPRRFGLADLQVLRPWKPGRDHPPPSGVCLGARKAPPRGQARAAAGRAVLRGRAAPCARKALCDPKALCGQGGLG